MQKARRGALNRRLHCKRVGENRALETLPQDLDLTALRGVEEHDLAFHKAVIEELLGMLARYIGYKARPF